LKWDFCIEINVKGLEELGPHRCLALFELFPLSSFAVTEARSHGVGYYGFSQDEAKRRAQQDALSKLRQETQREQVAAHGLRERRQQQLQARLKAARQRKRARLGLPPEEDGKISTSHSQTRGRKLSMEMCTHECLQFEILYGIIECHGSLPQLPLYTLMPWRLSTVTVLLLLETSVSEIRLGTYCTTRL
jgi:hypothetical protein